MKPTRSPRRILLPALLLLLACAAAPAVSAPSQTETKTETKLDVRGRITQFRRASYGEPPLASFVVEGALEPDTRYARAKVRITRDTKVFQTRGGKRLVFSRLQVGNLVEVTFEGPVAESDPVQAVAAEVVLLDSEPVHQ